MKNPKNLVGLVLYLGSKTCVQVTSRYLPVTDVAGIICINIYLPPSANVYVSDFVPLDEFSKIITRI